MLQRLIEAALQRRVLVLLLAVALVVHGISVVAHARLDVLPDFAPPQVTVQTECPGRTAEQVEAEVTLPIESAVQGAVGVAAVRSESLQGLSLVQVVFGEHVDPFRGRQSISELLAEAAARLPADVAAPRLTPLTSATMDLLKIGLLSDRLTPLELRDLAHWTIEPHLRAVPGVASVSLFGGEVPRVEIQVHGERLAVAGLTLQDIVTATTAAVGVRATGYLDSSTQRFVVRTDGGPQSTENLRQIVVGQRAGVPMRLLEVADVVEGPAPMFGDCLIQGRAGVLMTMTSQFGANTMLVTQAVEAALDDLRPLLLGEGVALLDRLHRPATFIERALANLAHSLLLGAVLVAAVLLLFLRNLRAASISIVAIPLSLLTAVIVLDGFGFALDTMAIGGLAMALGEVVDDAIIDVENIVRRLRQNRLLPAPRRTMDVVLSASLEVRSAVVQATLIVTLVFLPVISMQGLAGRLFAPLGVAYVTAVGASLLVALTITPAMALLLLSGKRAERQEREQLPLANAFGRLQDRLLPHPGKLLAIVTVLCLSGLALLRNLGGEFIPPFREGHFVAHCNMAPGTSIAEMRRLGTRVSEALLGTGHIATVEQQIGRTELGEDPWPPNQSEFHIELQPMPGAQEAEVEDEIRSILHGFPGVTTDVLTFLGDRIGETITGETADIVVTAFGEDLDQLDRIASDLVSTLGHVPGLVDAQLSRQSREPQLSVHFRPTDLAACGLNSGEVLDAIAVACQGRKIAQLNRGTRSHDLVVALAPSQRRDVASLAALPIRSTAGRAVSLAAVADVDLGHGRASILHEGGRRRQVVTGNVQGRSQDEVLASVRQRVAAVPMPAGVQVTAHGAAEQRAAASSKLLEGALLVGAAVLVMLRTAFRNLRNTLLVLVNLPFAFVGGVLAVTITGAGIDMGAVVGFVTLFGITTRNSIMLLSHFEHLVHVEGSAWNAATARRGTQERLRPILMTALVTALGLLPIALGRGEAGREIEGPMALVIVGGLCTSTLLNLLVLPALCLRFGRFDPSSEPR